MVLRKGGRIPNDLRFYYDGNVIEIVKSFVYLSSVFTAGGFFSEAQNKLSGQASKAVFKMNKCLYRFADVSVRRRLELFDKLILPIFNYGGEVWGFNKGLSFERFHMQFCKVF